MSKVRRVLLPPRAASVPGAVDSSRLLFDALLTLLQLGKLEGLQWLAALPRLLLVELCRLPVFALAWLSFSGFVACAVYALAPQVVWAAGSVLALQVGLCLALEARRRQLRARMQFSETRKGLQALQASLAERCK